MNVAQALQIRGEVDSYERQENLWLLADTMQLSALHLRLHPQLQLTQAQSEFYLAAIKRLNQAEPLAYILGYQSFWKYQFNVSTATLVPRPDSEILVETVLKLKLAKQAKILDLGTGSGALAITLALECPASQVIAVDISAQALQVAQANATALGADHVDFYQGSWFAALADTDHRFDLIISNPPYISEQDPHLTALKHEPRSALVAADHGLADIIQIINQAAKWLRHDGYLIIEHGYDQAQAMYQLMQQAGFMSIKTIKDYGANDRATLGQYHHV